MPRDCSLYVGNLPSDVRTRDLEDLFDKYGKIADIALKDRKSPPFAFVDFEDPRDAEDAVKGRDGYDFDGHRLRVELRRGAGPRGPGGRNFEDRGRNFEDRGRSFEERGRRSDARRAEPPRRSKYRVEVTGLPNTGSWQDLKDHMKKAGEVCFADVNGDGTGVVEFSHADDVEYALKKLDDTKFRSHKGDSAYIRVREAGGARRSRSRSRSRRASPRYSRSRSNSRSRSRSRSPAKKGGERKKSASRSRSRSASRSRSRSPDVKSQKRRSPGGSRTPSPSAKKTRSEGSRSASISKSRSASPSNP